MVGDYTPDARAACEVKILLATEDTDGINEREQCRKVPGDHTDGNSKAGMTCRHHVRVFRGKNGFQSDAKLFSAAAKVASNAA